MTNNRIMLRRYLRGVSLVFGLAYIFVGSAEIVYANLPQSPNFQLDESTVGSGGLIQSSSNNFQSSNALNDLAIGNSASSNFQVEAGSQTTHDPTLSFKVDSFDINFGRFSASTPAVTTAQFSVSNYTSYGYIVQIVGEAPSNGDHEIDTMAISGPSQPGIEQFGINLVANTQPESVGANPNNGQFGHGFASPNYDTTNEFRFVSGETIAFAPKSSGETIYTMSYLVNVDGLTPGGQYTTNQTLIVTGTY